ncbi:NADPH-dependent FMN reductase [Kroppenstedtia eburnea]|uniref:NADPH-dependent FMN reductase n=1 Tax=Kroppenstedtia sanguinis TaxID=1380684 RepID=A0ABW4C424_9BACL
MSEIIALSGSPSEHSRTDCVLRFLCYLVEREGLSTTRISVRNFAPEDLVYARFDSPQIEALATSIREARGLMIAAPVYKASYPGVLKALLDLLPQDILKDTPTFPLMTGGSMAHLLTIEYALKPLLATMKAKNSQGVYLLDHQVDREKERNPILDPGALCRLKSELYRFVQEVQESKKINGWRDSK